MDPIIANSTVPQRAEENNNQPQISDTTMNQIIADRAENGDKCPFRLWEKIDMLLWSSWNLQM